MNINIISNSHCELMVDVVGYYQLTLISVAGLFNTSILNEDDYLEFDNEKIEFEEFVNITPQIFADYVNAKYHEIGNTDDLLEYNDSTTKFIFNKQIIACSDRVKYMLGIRSFPANKSEQATAFNNSQYIFIKSNNLSSPMRYSWQTRPKDKNILQTKYATVQNIVSVNLNTFTVGFPFSLAGNTYTVDESLLKYISFDITDIYGNEIIFQNDIVWTFTLEKLAEPLSSAHYESNE